MGLQINTNIAAMNAYRNLAGTQVSMATSLERLSSGLRINRAADDAAGLAISEKLRAQIGGLNQATANAQDGISLIQTAEGALNESHSILQRMRQLAVQAANDTNTPADRQQITKEVDQLSAELGRIASDTEFNGAPLLTGAYSATPLKFQIGANSGQTIDVNIDSMDIASLGLGSGTKASSSNPAGVVAYVPGAGAETPFGSFTINAAKDVLDSTGLKVGAYDDTTKIATFTDATKNGTVTFTTSALVGGVGGFSISNGVDVSTQDSASTAIDTISAAIDLVSSQRADLGAIQNRLQHVVNRLTVAAENTSAAESRIRDTDMAKEMTAFTRSQILQQAGVSMLAQANSAPQSVLKLLG